MQTKTKQFRISGYGKRANSVGKNFLHPVIDVKPYNPWQSTYIQNYNKPLKRNASQVPIKSKKPVNNSSQPIFQPVQAVQSQKDFKVVSNPLTIIQEQKNNSNVKEQPQEEEGKEFEIKPNISEVFPNKKSYRDRKLNCIIADNAEYFAHVMGKCICGLCTCGKCKCKHPRELHLGLKHINEQSLYKQDYIKHAAPAKRQLKRQGTEQFISKEPFADNTLYRTDYVKLDPEKVIEPQRLDRIDKPSYEDAFGKLKAPFPKSSLYKETYLNWHNSVPVVRFNDKEEYNKIKFPFMGKASNKEYGNFNPEDITDQVNKSMFGKQEFKNPLGPNSNFRGESTTHNTYKKIEGYDQPRKYKETHNKENTINAEGHFNSTYKDYAGTNPPSCPAKEIITQARQQVIDQSMRKYSDLLKKLT